MEALSSQYRYDKQASYLLFFAFGSSVVFNYFLKEGYFASGNNQKGYIILWVCTPLVLFIYYYIGKGHKGAKTTFLTLYGLVVITSLANYQGAIASQLTTSLKAINYVSQNVLQLLACVLMIIGFMSPKSS